MSAILPAAVSDWDIRYANDDYDLRFRLFSKENYLTSQSVSFIKHSCDL